VDPVRVRRHQRAIAALAAAASVALLAACSGGGSSADVTGTVEEQIGFDGDAVAQRTAEAENLIHDCMQRQGFEYVPVDPAAQQEALTGVKGLTKDEFEQQFGYGITTLYEQRLQNAELGPNRAIRESLPASDRAAYDQTLYGDDPTATLAVALDTGDFTRLGGCVREAADDAFGGAQVLGDLTAKLDQLDERIVADPRMVDAIAQWSRCMRDAGYPLGDPDEVDVVLQTELEAIVGPPESPDPDYDRTALRALQHEEVAMVTQDLACEDQHIATVEEEVRVEYERAFRERNAGLIERVAAR
jgi:hypothetical protein